MYIALKYAKPGFKIIRGITPTPRYFMHYMLLFIYVDFVLYLNVMFVTYYSKTMKLAKKILNQK